MGFFMLRRAYLINVIVSAIGTVLCLAITPTKSEFFGAVRESFDAHALNNALLSPIVFGTITLRSN